MSYKSKSIQNGTPKENIKLMKILSILHGDIKNNKWLPGYVFPICNQTKYNDTDREILIDIMEELNIKYKIDDSNLTLCQLINDKIGDYTLTEIVSSKIGKLFTSVFKNLNSTVYLQHTINIFNTIYSIPVFRTLMFKNNISLSDIKFISEDYRFKEADILELLSNMLIVIKKIILNLEKALRLKKNNFNLLNLKNGIEPDFWFNSTFDERQKIVVIELINRLNDIMNKSESICKQLLKDNDTKIQIKNKIEFGEEDVEKSSLKLIGLIATPIAGVVLTTAMVFIIKFLSNKYNIDKDILDIFSYTYFNKYQNIDPKKYYCTRPYNRDVDDIRYRIRSCEQGKRPHRIFKTGFANKQQCVEKCHT